jgi:type I restriction enzyme S subunit
MKQLRDFEGEALISYPRCPLPATWSQCQLRRVATIESGRDYKGVEVLEGGYPVFGSGGEFARASDYLYDGESVLFGRKGTIDKPLHVTGRFWTVDTMLYTKLSTRIDGRFFHYYATTMPFDYYSTNTAVPSMTEEDLSGHKIPLPPKSVQRAIADYLDQETARIDTLIEKQEELIETLRERRLALVDQSVWSGLGRQNLEPTGIETAPWAPDHWVRSRNRRLLRERTAVSLDGAESLLSVSHITGVSPRANKSVTMAASESLAGYRLVCRNDLVVNTMWAWMGALGVSDHEGVVSPAYAVYEPVNRCAFEPRYFNYLYRSSPYVAEITRHSKGVWTSRLRIYPEAFLNLLTVIPPRSEQTAIADYLDQRTRKIDALEERTQQFIKLTKERRSALITAAVTGQIDVRGSADG